MVDNLLKKYGVGAALTLMILELAYINAKSLIFMSRGLVGLDDTFNVTGIDSTMGIVGSFAFSAVTVLIMRLSKKEWLKLVFPLFDFMLVFLGFNIEFANDFMANPFRFWYSIFIAAFAGFTTYSLGQINADQHADVTKSKLVSAERENELLHSNIEQTQKENERLRIQRDTYYEGYLKYCRGNILKKRGEKTETDKKLLQDYDEYFGATA
jgi:hypothetical protein